MTPISTHAILRLLLPAALSAASPLERSVYIEAARNAARVGNAEEAVSRFDAAAALAPLTSEEELARAQALVASGRASVAVATLQRLISSHPGDAVYEQALAQALLATGEVGPAAELLGASPGPQSAEADEARRELSVDELRAELEARPGDHWATRELGRALTKAENHEEALSYLLATLVNFPDDLRVRQDLGTSLLRSGRPAEGAKELRRVLDAEPENRVVRNLLSKALVRTGEHREAISRIDELGPGSGNERRRALSQARIARGLDDLRPLETFFADAPGDARLGMALAQAHMRLRAPASAAQVLDDLIAAGESGAEVLRLALRARRDADLDPTGVLRRLLELRPADSDLARQLGDALDAAGRSAEAVEIWRGLVEAGGTARDERRLVLAAWAAGDTNLVATHAPRVTRAQPNAKEGSEESELASAARAALLAKGHWRELLEITPWPGAPSAWAHLAASDSLAPTQQVAALEPIWRAEPHPPVARALAEALVRVGRANEALQLMDRSPRRLDTPEDDLLRARAHIDLVRAGEAGTLLDALPDSVATAAAPLRAELHLLHGDPQAAIETLARHCEAQRNDRKRARRLAELLAWRALHGGGTGALIDTLESRHPDDPRIAAAKIRCLVGQGDAEAAYLRLKSWTGRNVVDSRLALRADLDAASAQAAGAVLAADSLAAIGGALLPRCRALASAEQPERARHLLTRRIAADPADRLARLELAHLDRVPVPIVPHPPAPWVDEELTLPHDRIVARAHAAQLAGEADAAAALLDSLLIADPSDRPVRIALARLLRTSDRPAESLPHYAHLLGDAPGRIDWAIEEARALTSAGMHKEATDAWGALVEGARGRSDIEIEAEAAREEARGDLHHALDRHSELLERWPEHRPAREAVLRLVARLELEQEARRVALGTLAPQPGPGMPLAYAREPEQFGAESALIGLTRHGRMAGVRLSTQRIDLAAGSLWGADLDLERITHSDPTDADRESVSLNSLVAAARFPSDPAALGWGVVADGRFTLGAAEVGSRLDGGLGLSFRRDSQSVFMIGVESRPWLETLDTVLEGMARRGLVGRVGSSVLDDRFRLEIAGQGSSLSDDNFFWHGIARTTVALGPQYRSLLLGAEIELTGFHRHSPDYYSPRRNSRLLGTLALSRRPASDEPTPSKWSWGFEGGFGVEDAPGDPSTVQPVGRLDLRVTRPLGPLGLEMRLHRLLAPDYHESGLDLRGRFEF